MARLDTDLLGLPIVSKEDASIAGEVDGLIIDEQSLRVAGFLVDLSLYEARVLPFAKAQAIGEDAIIVEAASAVARLSEDQELEDLTEREITLSGVVAITLAGNNVGAVGDFFVDGRSGDLVGFEFLPLEEAVYPRDTVVLPISVVHRLGRDIVVLTNDYDQHFMPNGEALTRSEARTDRVTGLGRPEPVAPAPPQADADESPTQLRASGPPSVAEESPAETAEVEPEPPVAEEAEQTQVPEKSQAPEQDIAPEQAVAPGETAPDSLAPEPDGAAEKDPPEETATAEISPAAADEDNLASQQRHFLVGKKVLRRIESPSGEVIAGEGDVVDYEMIQRAKSHDLLLILSLNVD